jgi:hypothetical protein
MSRAEPAGLAEVTTNYVSRLEGEGSPGIDPVARLAHALGVPVADLLPTAPDWDDLAVTRRKARELFDELVGSEDRAVLLLLTQAMARLSEAGHARPRKARIAAVGACLRKLLMIAYGVLKNLFPFDPLWGRKKPA